MSKLETKRPWMSGAEMAKLVDAAMNSNAPDVYLQSLVTTFDELGRTDDAVIAACVRELFVKGEIEMIMSLRAQWLGKKL